MKGALVASLLIQALVVVPSGTAAAPDDPSINPDAVDIPNDGIDQDCSGADLIVGSGTLPSTLIWDNDNDNDQDLHVIEPGGTRIWYAAAGANGDPHPMRAS